VEGTVLMVSVTVGVMTGAVDVGLVGGNCSR